nr:MAG: hypothetical protein DIU56_05115 [Pseudomonadota bacterium]
MVIAALAALSSVRAHAQFRVMINAEEGIETSASSVVLPSSTEGSLLVTPCTGCAPLTLRASAQTRYFVGDNPVTLGELRAMLATAGDVQLVVTYDRETRALNRVIAPYLAGSR